MFPRTEDVIFNGLNKKLSEHKGVFDLSELRSFAPFLTGNTFAVAGYWTQGNSGERKTLCSGCLDCSTIEPQKETRNAFSFRSREANRKETNQ